MSKPQAMNILRIDSSVRGESSVTRSLADELVQRLIEQHPDASIHSRDLADGLPLIDSDWVEANFSDAAERNAEQNRRLALSETLIGELENSDVLVLAAPIYNFSIPAALKAWIDQVMRARRTFRYTENGPLGLLKDRPVFLLMASGGTPVGGEMDFAGGYLRHVLGFMGLRDVRLVAADQMNVNAEVSLQRAGRQIAGLLPGSSAAA